MEEKKIASKEVKMNPNVKQEQPKEYSREELKQICDQQQSQLQQANVYIQKLHQQIQQMGAVINDKRMDYLFKVIEISSRENQASEYACFAKDFVENCVQEIQEALTVPEQHQAEPSKQEN